MCSSIVLTFWHLYNKKAEASNDVSTSYLWLEKSLILDKPCLHKLIERDEVQMWEWRLVKYIEMAVLRHQVVSTSCKSAIDKLVVI